MDLVGGVNLVQKFLILNEIIGGILLIEKLESYNYLLKLREKPEVSAS